MHLLIALIAPVFSAIFLPAAGGSLEWTQQTDTTPVVFTTGSTATCSVTLSEEEALSVADVLIDVVDNDAPGKLVMPVAGGSVRIANLGAGDVHLSTNNVSACGVRLVASLDEPEQVIDIFMNAAK